MTTSASSSPLPSTRRARLAETVEPLSDVSPAWAVALPLVPIAVAVLGIAVVHAAAMGADPGLPPQFPNLPLGIGGVAALAALYWRWDGRVWTASAVFRQPSRGEVGAALGATVVGIALAVGVNLLAVAAGVEPHDPGRIETTLGLVAVLFGSVVVAPVAEEVLFRGLLLGHLLDRGFGVPAAVGASALLFGGMHVFVAGLASVVVAAILGLVLTALRLWYDNLVGAWLAHLLINVWGLLVSLAVVPVPW